MLLSKHDPQHASTGDPGVLRWRTPSGLRFDENQTTLGLEAFCMTNEAPDGNGGIKRVYFQISVNGGPLTYKFLYSRELRQPINFDYASPLPGAPSTGPAPFMGYGLDLDLTAYDGGYIDITLRAENLAAGFMNGGTIRIYNDTDGVDRRPNTREVYLDPAAASGGSGESQDPVNTLTAAMGKVMYNPGSDASSRNIGGAVIYVLGDLDTTAMTSGGSEWYTGQHHLTFKSLGGRHTIQLSADGSYTTADKLWGACYAGNETNITFQGFDIVGPGPYLEKEGGAGSTVCMRLVDCNISSSWYSLFETRPSILCLGDAGAPLVASDMTNTRFEAIGCSMLGTKDGYVGFDLVVDSMCYLVPGVNLSNNTDEFLYQDVFIDEKPGVGPGDIQGYVDLTGGTDFQIQNPTTDVMRIQSLDPTHERFDVEIGTLLSSSYWGVTVTGANNGANNGTFILVGAGIDGQSRPYVDLENASVVEESAMTGAGQIQTARASDGVLPDAIITDIAGVRAGSRWDGCGISGLSMRYCIGGYSLDLNGQTADHVALEDIYDGDPSLTLDLDDAGFTHLLMRNCSWTGTTFVFNAGAPWTGSSLVDNQWSDTPTNFPSGWLLGNHFDAGAGAGVASSTGTWVQNTGMGGRSTDPHRNINGDIPSIAEWVEN